MDLEFNNWKVVKLSISISTSGYKKGVPKD